MSEPIRFAVAGSGFRARNYLAVAAALPDRLEVTGVLTHHPEALAAPHDFPVVDNLDALLATKPSFVLTAVSAGAGAALTRALAERGARVLAETPPATDADALTTLVKEVGPTGLVQVAEQYPLQPMVAARLAAIRAGGVGAPTSAYLSMTQTYHAVAVLRAALGVGRASAEVRAHAHTAPLVQPVTRAGWTRDDAAHDLVTTTATLDFGAAVAHYDFTEGQTRNPLRGIRFVARGSTGELIDDRLTRLTGPTTVVTSTFERRQTGLHHDFEIVDLDQISLDGEVLFRNPYYGARFSDEEIAMAAILEAAGRWATDAGAPPYPLVEAAHDQFLGLAIARAAETGETVRVAAG